jgi:hypothetical protein
VKTLRERSEDAYPKGAITVIPELFPNKKQQEHLEYSVKECALRACVGKIWRTPKGMAYVPSVVVISSFDDNGEEFLQIEMTPAEAEHLWKNLGVAVEHFRDKSGDAAHILRIAPFSDKEDS